MSAIPPRPVGTAYTNANSISKGGWVEYVTPEGRKYYFNRVTSQTTWEKPNELKTIAELADVSNPWKEFVADSGQKYYYNSVTLESTWEEPPETKAQRDPAAAERDKKAREDSAKAAEEERQKEKEKEKKLQKAAFDQHVSNPKEVVYTTQQERVDAFKGLLEFAGVTSTWTWEMTLQAIQGDERFKAIKTLGEKKQILQEFKNDKRQQERDERRKKDAKTRDIFIQMLKECKEITPKMPWRKAIPYFEGDIRFDAIVEKEREGLYEDYLLELERTQREQAREARKNHMRLLREKLEQDKTINISSQWRKIKELFKDDINFKALEKFDRLVVFEDYVRDLEKVEEEKKRNDLVQQKKVSRQNREAFRFLLMECYENNVLTYRMKWKDFQKLIKDDARYKSMVIPDQLGSLPSELFGDFMEDIEEKYHKDKKTMKQILKETNHYFDPKTSYEDFIKIISASSLFSNISEKNRVLLHEYCLDKISHEEKKKEKEAERKKKKIYNQYIDLLEDTRSITSYSKWVEVRPILADHSAFKKMPNEDERERIFNEYLIKKREDSSDEEGRIKERDDRHPHKNSVDINGTQEKPDKNSIKHHKRRHSGDDSGDERKRSRSNGSNGSSEHLK